ncbi:MAG: epsD 1 [Gemmatimonadetes bacterium]|jgi:glycosyltransferase involved in cell wall biosynthesis|nr:epsD 1 [Gemmatimonadota bacterium]
MAPFPVIPRRMPAGHVDTPTRWAVPQGPTPLRVLHLDTERGWRGGERQVLGLSRGLTALGAGNVIAARTGEPLATRAQECRMELVTLDPSFEADPRAAWALRRAIQRHDIDIVHAHTAHGAALAALATLGTAIPFVAARRVDFPLRDNAGTRWKYGRASAIIAVSEAVAAIVQRAGLQTPVVVVPDGTDVRRVRTPATPETLALLGVPRNAPLVVQVSQLVGHKDPLTFVDAIAAAHKRMPSLHALLVGDGPLRGAVEAAVRARHLEDVLHVTGYRTDADELLAAADVVTLSSREEGMGSVLLDALVFARPVAATRAGGIPEIVRDGETGLLSAVGDGEALGASIVMLLTDRSRGARMGAAARARAPEFSLEAMAMRTRDVYDDVLARRRPA